MVATTMSHQTPNRFVGTKSAATTTNQFTDIEEARFVEMLSAMEVGVFTAMQEFVASPQEWWSAQEEICEEMLEFCNGLMIRSGLVEEENEEIAPSYERIEFGRVERNKLIRRLLDCLIVVNNGSVLQPPDAVRVKILQVINVLMDLHCRCANQIGINDNFEDVEKELAIVNTLITIDFYLIVGVGIQRQDLLREIFINILYCVKSVQDFEKFTHPQIKQFIKRVVSNLLDEIIMRSIKESPSLRGIVASTLQCIINCTRVSSLFRSELIQCHFGRIVNLLALPFDFGRSNIFGEYMINTHIGILSLFYKLLSYCLINYPDLLIPLVDANYLAEMTDVLLAYCCNNCDGSSNHSFTTTTTPTIDEILLDPLVLLYTLSTHGYNVLFTPKRSKEYISTIKVLIHSKYISASSKANIISIIRKWMEIYSNHMTNNSNITHLVEEILSQNLPLAIFCQLTNSSPPLTLRINNFLSWMISALNSNDITQIHKFSEYLALNVIGPFASCSLTDSSSPLQSILDKLLQEPRLITTLTENKILSLIDEKSLNIDANMRKLMLETEKEQDKFTSMLKALPPQDKKLLQITEGNLFIKKLQ